MTTETTTMSQQTEVLPLLKWTGSKHRIVSSVVDSFPRVIRNYYEPFVGSMSVFFELMRRVDSGSIIVNGDYYLSDLCQPLVNMYQVAKTDPELLNAELNRLSVEYLRLPNPAKTPGRAPKRVFDSEYSQRTISMEWYYYYIRELFNKRTPNAYSVIDAAHTIFLNRVGWRGVYRTNKSGGFNVPFGNYPNPTIACAEKVNALSALLNKSKIHIACYDFGDCIHSATEGDFVYFDPPYAETFTGYNADSFAGKHIELFDTIKQARYSWVMSNSNSDTVRGAFDNEMYELTEISIQSLMNSKTPGKRVTELLVKLKL